MAETFGFDLTIRRGDDRMLDLAIVQDDGVTPQDLSGALLWFTAKRRLSDADADAVLAYREGAGITITNAAAGTATVLVVGTDTAGLADGDIALLCDVQIRPLGGRVYTAAYGRLIVQPDITRSTS